MEHLLKLQTCLFVVEPRQCPWTVISIKSDGMGLDKGYYIVKLLFSFSISQIFRIQGQLPINALASIANR